MTRRQEDGPDSRSNFRTDRMFQSGGRWYFYTREGTTEGPFESQVDAQERLSLYIDVLESTLLSPDTELSLMNG
ncbi:MAG: DUF6316 family protein [Halioglobus sp.]